MHTEQDARRSKWASTVNEFKNSGLTQADFCKNNKLNLKQFNYWFRKFKLEEQPLQWLKVEQEKIPQQHSSKNSSNTLNIKIGNVTIEVQDGFNSSLLVQVIDTLRSIC